MATMQNVLNHIQCGIFVLGIESNTDGSISDDLQFILRFHLVNDTFVRLIFGQHSTDQVVDLIGLQPHECLPSEFIQSLNKHISQCLRSQQNIEYSAKLDLITNHDKLLGLVKILLIYRHQKPR